MARIYEVAFVGIDGTDESQLVISIRHPDPTATADSINLRVSRAALLEFAKHLPIAEELKAHSDQDAADAVALKAAEDREEWRDTQYHTVSQIALPHLPAALAPVAAAEEPKEHSDQDTEPKEQ
jgi:hypothetical protein